MCQFNELLPVTKSEKCGAIKWVRATDNDHSPVAGTLTISGKRSHCSYRIEEFPADAGRGFVLVKLDAGTDASEGHYAVYVGPRSTTICECRGYYAVGRCKHVVAVLTLIDAGQL